MADADVSYGMIMPIKWKSIKKFKPDVVLSRIEKSRVVNDDGGTSFGGFQIHQDAATIYSMLDFPEVASEMDKPALVWNALFRARPNLSAASFIDAINKEVNSGLSRKEESYCFLAAISLDGGQWPKKISVLGASMELHGFYFPKKFVSRKSLIERHAKHVDVSHSPEKYCAITVRVRAKSNQVAASKSLRSIDIFRAILCLEGNLGMQMSFGGSDYKPINVVRLGSFQSLHKMDGTVACDALWYEPTYQEAKIYRFKKPEIVKKNMRYALRRIGSSKFGKDIAESLVRYVRALDDPDPNTSFLRLWGAFESLLTPGRADYDSLVDRCSFLFQDPEYHRQVLMHLREYRNASVHAGQETTQAKTNCFLLQSYYRYVFWFLIDQSLSYQSLSEVHEFLSMSDDINFLKHQRRLYDRAIKYLTP